MDETAKNEWAFHAWTMISSRLSFSPNRGFVCGIISAQHGEGRSTWIDLLVSAASRRGLKVMTMTAGSSVDPGIQEPSCPADPEAPASVTSKPAEDSKMLTTTAPFTPAHLAEKLNGTNAHQTAHIPLPGSVWNLEHRTEWRSVLAQWHSLENLAVLVELPPASVSEALLLAEGLPQVIWLTGSGIAKEAETRQYLTILRHARCNLVGAVLNLEPSYPILDRFTHRIHG
jgi:hypothetical protein